MIRNVCEEIYKATAFNQIKIKGVLEGALGFYGDLTQLNKLLQQINTSFALTTTIFVDTRLWKTKQPRKRFQNFCQSCLLLTDRIEIHQLQPLVTFLPSLQEVSNIQCPF